MKVKSPSVNVLSRLYFLASSLTKAERVCIARLASSTTTVETASLPKLPIVSLAEKGYVVFGKNAKLTGKGRKLGDIRLAEETR